MDSVQPNNSDVRISNSDNETLGKDEEDLGDFTAEKTWGLSELVVDVVVEVVLDFVLVVFFGWIWRWWAPFRRLTDMTTLEWQPPSLSRAEKT